MSVRRLQNMMSGLLFPNNFIEQISDAQDDIQDNVRTPVWVNTLGDLSDDLGSQRSGEFLAMTSGDRPIDPDACGVFMSAFGEEFGGQIFNIGGVNNGELQFGMKAVDGTALFANGQGIIDSSGVNLAGIRYALKHYAESALGLTPRYGRYEMLFPDGKIIPSLALTYMDGLSGAELVVNGDFETGDFTGWTPSGTAAVVSPGYGSSVYCAEIPPASYTSQDIAVSGSQPYVFSVQVETPGTMFLVIIRWYDAGSSLIGSDSLNISSPPTTWQFITKNYVSPPTAASVNIQIGSTNTCHYDDVSFKAVSFFRQLLFAPEAELYNGSEYKKVIGAKKELYVPLSPTFTTGYIIGNCTNGIHYVKVSFYDAEGETILSPASAAITVDGTHKRITVNLQTGPWGTVGRKVYMTAAGGTDYYFVTQIVNNTTTTYMIDQDDSTLVDLAPDTINTTGSRPQFPRSCMKFGFDFTMVDASYTPVANPIQTITSQVLFQFYTIPTALNANDGDRYQCDMYLEGGDYDFTFYGIKATSSPIVYLYIDGLAVSGPHDLYAAATAYDYSFTVTSIPIVGNGLHLVEWVVTGKNGSSTDYRIGMTYTQAIKSPFIASP